MHQYYLNVLFHFKKQIDCFDEAYILLFKKNYTPRSSDLQVP